MTAQENINSRIDMIKKCINTLKDKKAIDPVALDLREVNSYLDYFIIATGNSHMHCRSLAKEVRKFFSEQGISEMGKPDLDSGWIALDYADIIVHIFTEDLRVYYQLEKLWADAAKI